MEGGIWNEEKKLWKIPIYIEWQLNIEDHIVKKIWLQVEK